MTIFGPDMSHYDVVPDGGLLVAEGFQFMTHKAGGDANDAELKPWWLEFEPHRAQILPGAYWVLYPGDPSGRADDFLARLDSECAGWRDGPFALQIDAEIWSGDTSTKPSIAECNAFADRLVSEMPKLTPIGYLPEWVYGNSVSSFRYPLWASSYVSGSGAASVLYPGDSSSHWGAYGGKTPDILQFTSKATIAWQTTCDANAYRGTLAELTALVAPGWKVPDMELTDKIGDATYANRTVGDVLRDLEKLRDFLVGDVAGTTTANIKATAPAQRLPAISDLQAAVAALDAKVSLLGTPSVDVAALAAALAPNIEGITEDEMKVLLESIDIRIAPIA
jgi:hypothetical protein